MKTEKQLALKLYPRHRPLGSRPELCRKYHKRMYDWIAQNPHKWKCDWPPLEKNKIKSGEHYCFACLVAEYRASRKEGFYEHKFKCIHCPIKSFSAIASRYEERMGRTPCENHGPYHRILNLKHERDILEKKLKICQSTAEKIVIETNLMEIDRLISINSLAFANIW